MVPASELALADAFCRHLTRHHYENFWVASLLAPRARRIHLQRLYAFCRITDDLGDENGARAIPRLRLWQEDLARCFGGEVPPLHPALVGLAETIARYELPPEPFYDLVAANVQDQHVSQYESWDELYAYCCRSAAPVGRLVLRIFETASAELDTLADDVCIGLQLANFAQDVSVDRTKGRTYLLQAELRELGTTGAIRAMCERAASLLSSGRELEARVSASLRPQLALYRLGGEAILRAIAESGYDTERRRPEVPMTVKVRLLAAVGWQMRGRSEHARGVEAS